MEKSLPGVTRKSGFLQEEVVSAGPGWQVVPLNGRLGESGSNCPSPRTDRGASSSLPVPQPQPASASPSGPCSQVLLSSPAFSCSCLPAPLSWALPVPPQPTSLPLFNLFFSVNECLLSTRLALETRQPTQQNLPPSWSRQSGSGGRQHTG